MQDCHSLQIDFIAQESRLNRIDPGLKLLLALSSLLLCLSAKRGWTIGIVSVLMMALIILVGKVSWKTYLKLLTIPLVFILLSCLGILIELPKSAIGLINIPFGRGYLSITTASIARAMEAAIRSYAALTCLFMISLSTPLAEIIATFRKWKLPEIMIELMFLIYRYLTIILEVHYHMFISARCRGGYSNYQNSFRSMLGIAQNLLLLSFRKASASYDAMIARGYNGRLEFWQEEKLIHKKDQILAGLYLCFLLALFVMERIIL